MLERTIGLLLMCWSEEQVRKASRVKNPKVKYVVVSERVMPNKGKRQDIFCAKQKKLTCEISQAVFETLAVEELDPSVIRTLLASPHFLAMNKDKHCQ